MSDRTPLNEAAVQRRRLPPEPAATLAPDLTADAAPPPRRPMRTRKPFGGHEQKLFYPSRDGYHRHWFNDEPGRLMRAQEAGYDHVTDEAGRNVSTVVGIGRGGGALSAYLMETPIEWYREDMQAQDDAVLGQLGQIQRGDYERPAGRDGQLRYAGSSKGDISITTSNRR